MKTRYINIKTAIGEFIEDLDLQEKEIDEDLLVRQAEDAVRYFVTDEQTIHKIVILDVHNYKADCPNDFLINCEIAYRLEKPEGCGTRKQQITKFAQSTAEGCELEISVSCPKCHKTECKGCGQDAVVVEVDRIWEMANSHYYHSTRFMSDRGVQSFGRGEYPSVYSDTFQLMKPSTNDWFQIDKHLPDCANVHCQECKETYRFQDPNIEVSFRKGEILLAYLARPTDEDGNLLVPNDHRAFEAIQDYLTMKMCKKEYFSDKENRAYYIAYKDAKQDWTQSAARARSALQIPSHEDWMAWINNNPYNKTDRAYDKRIRGCN